MKKIILISSLFIMLFITSCNLESYKYKYVLDMENYKDVITFSTRLVDNDEVYTVELLTTQEGIKLVEYEIDIKYTSSGALGYTTHEGTFTPETSDHTLRFDANMFETKYSNIEVVDVSGYFVTNTKNDSYTEFKELSDNEQEKLKNEIQEKLSVLNSNIMTISTDITITNEGFRSQSISQEIGLDLENNYMHVLMNRNEGIVLYQKDDTFYLSAFYKHLSKNHLMGVEKLDINSIEDYEDFSDPNIIIDDTFIIRKVDDKYKLETTFNDFLISTNQAELIESLGEFKNRKISLTLTFHEDSFMIYTNMVFDDVTITMQMEYKINLLYKIDIENAVSNGDLTMSKKMDIRDYKHKITNHIIPTGGRIYYRYQLEDGYYKFNLETLGEYNVGLTVYNLDTNQKVSPSNPDNYLNLYYENLYQLKKGDYAIMIHNDHSLMNKYDLEILNAYDLETVFNAYEPEIIDPKGDIKINFETDFDPVAIKFTHDQTKLIRITYEEDIKVFPNELKNDWITDIYATQIDSKTIEFVLEEDKTLVFVAKEKGTININVEILATEVENPLKLIDNQTDYLFSLGKDVYEIEIEAPSVLSLKLSYLNPKIKNGLYIIFKNESFPKYISVNATLEVNSLTDVYLIPGKYYINVYSQRPFNIKLEEIKTKASIDQKVIEPIVINDFKTTKERYTLTKNKVNSFKFTLTEDSMVSVESSVSSYYILKDGNEFFPFRMYQIMEYKAGTYEIFYNTFNTNNQTLDLGIHIMTHESLLNDDNKNSLEEIPSINLDTFIIPKMDFNKDIDMYMLTLDNKTTIYSNYEGYSIAPAIYTEDFMYIESIFNGQPITLEKGIYYIRIEHLYQPEFDITFEIKKA